LVVALFGGHWAAAVHVEHIPPARDLGDHAAQAESACIPLLIEFASDSCEYCELLEEEVLKPMLRNHDYDKRVAVRRVALNESVRLSDFDGSRISGAALAERYRIQVTPTLIFVDAQGDELTQRMVGITTLDFYGGYLDEALDAAGATLRARQRCP
jgi:thioredoxin-related protein